MLAEDFGPPGADHIDDGRVGVADDLFLLLYDPVQDV